MITRFVKLTFQEDKIEDFAEIWEESREKIAASEGCHFVEMHRAINPDNICFTHSVWKDEDSLNNYRHSELFQKTWKKTKALFSDKPEAWSLDSYGYEGNLEKL